MDLFGEGAGAEFGPQAVEIVAVEVVPVAAGDAVRLEDASISLNIPTHTQISKTGFPLGKKKLAETIENKNTHTESFNEIFTSLKISCLIFSSLTLTLFTALT